MATFPRLKTSAVAQYPARRTVAFRNQTVRFVDGAEQRYRDSAGALRQWEIRLERIDEGEAAALDEFFLTQQGAFGSFEFTDPWDGELYADCSFAIDEAEMESRGEMSGATKLIIQENVC
jgi:phage-related protein